jgi:MbtH protein
VPNAFEDADARYQVLVNDEGQHSLWPSSIRVPAGWTVVYETDSRTSCIQYVEDNWTDMRLRSLTQSDG